MSIPAANILTRMHHAILPAVLGLVAFGLGRPSAAWTEDFEDASWVERWVPFGRLAEGTWAQGAEGHWPKGEKTVFARREWWQLEDGAIRGANFPDEKHAAGLSRRERFPPSVQESLSKDKERIARSMARPQRFSG